MRIKKLKMLLLLPLVMIFITTSQAQQNTNILPTLSLLLFDQDPAKTVAYAWANRPSDPGPYTPDLAYSYNMTGGGVSITRSAPGIYEVKMPGLTFIEGNATTGYTGGVAILVSGSEEAYCTVFGRLVSSFIVACAESTSATEFSDARFNATVIQTTSRVSDAGIGFFHRIKQLTQLPAIGQTSQLTEDFYSSVGESISITKRAVGDYKYTYEGSVNLILSTPQVTLIDNRTSTPSKGHCNVAAVGENSFVKCFDINGNPTDAAHEVMIGWNNAPGNAKILAYAMPRSDGTPLAPGDVYNSSGITTQIERTGAGSYTLNFTGLVLPSNNQTGRQFSLQANAVSSGIDRCNIGTTLGPLRVVCKDLGDRGVASGFTAVVVGYE